MRLVEKEDQLRLVRVAHFRQRLEKLGQQPKQEGRVKPRRAHQLVGGQDVHLPAPISRSGHQVGKLKRGFTKEARPTLVLEYQKRSLDRPYRLGRNIAVPQRKLVAILADPDQQRLQVLEVEERHAFLVGHPEGDVHDPLLRLGQLQEA